MSTQKAEDNTLVGHLGELRKRLIVIFAVNIVAVVVCFQFAERVIEYFIKLNPGMQLVYISPAEQFTVYITLALLSGIIISFPVTIGQIWAFVVKGLTDKERRVGVVAMYFGLFFFILGVLFCYFVVLPFTLLYFFNMTLQDIPAMISIQSYVAFINTMLLSFGLVFEMPVVVFALTWLDIIKPAMLTKSRGILILVIFIIAAVATPPDLVSQVMLGVPMVALLQLSIFISKAVYAARHRDSAKGLAKTTALDS